MALKRIVVVVNKWWEMDPVMGVLLSDYVRPGPYLGWPALTRHPRPRPDQAALPPIEPAPKPRALFAMTKATVEVWCVSDLLEHLPDTGKYQSSSERKAERLPLVFRSGADCVISVGTAASMGPLSANGCVIVGPKVFMHNSHPGGSNPDSNWALGPFDTLLDFCVSADLLRKVSWLDTGIRRNLTERFLPSVLSPAPQATVLVDPNTVALGNVNVTDYREYEKTDAATIAAFRQSGIKLPPACLETTHGLIRAYGGDRFVFLSGIVNRTGHFADEVDPRAYAQNTTGAHNAGVVLAWVLPLLNDAV
jgi:hypothetical protein